MSFEVTTAFVNQFRDTVMMLAQQRGSKLRGTFMEDTLTGKSMFFDQISPTQAQRTTTRHADSPLISTPHRRRRVSSIDVEWGDLIDDFDKLRMLIDPQSAYSQNAAWAVGREMDDIMFEKFFADAATGEDGSGTTSFPAGQQVSKNSEGLNVDKLREARKILLQNEVDLDMETPYIAIPAKAQDDLLNQTEVTSSDFNTVRALVQGEIDTFLGMRFIRTERVPTDDSGDYRIPVWVPSGMALAVSKEPTARIEERPDKRFSQYVYYSMSVGATRLEEDKVVEIGALA